MISPFCAHSRTAWLASRATTRILAPVGRSPQILGSPTFPAPTPSTSRPSNFTNMGNKLFMVNLRFRGARARAKDLGAQAQLLLQPEMRASPRRSGVRKTAAGSPRWNDRLNIDEAGAQSNLGLRWRGSDSRP